MMRGKCVLPLIIVSLSIIDNMHRSTLLMCKVDESLFYTYGAGIVVSRLNSFKYGEESRMNILKPVFYDAFSCVGSDCLLTCCGGWCITVDEKTLKRYRKMGGEIARFARHGFFEAGRLC